MGTTNTISGTTYFFYGLGFFYIGLSSSRNGFNSWSSSVSPQFLQLSISVGGGTEVDYYQGAFT